MCLCNLPSIVRIEKKVMSANFHDNHWAAGQVAGLVASSGWVGATVG